ncbi:MAG: cytochrome c maturation protein CcmE [Pseudomonadaceae bacterium]|nr:cytochrome c maturation protein CcmE [Pseudomonadaceae bacterium]
MNPKRKSRLYLALFLLVAVAGTTAALMVAMEENINMFYPPDQVVDGTAPLERTIRAGGMVKAGSVSRDPESLQVEFTITDHLGSDFIVSFTGILPDLFREGQGIIVQGELDQQGKFMAREVLAKHDENYMPPELMDMVAESGKNAEAKAAAKATP